MQYVLSRLDQSAVSSRLRYLQVPVEQMFVHNAAVAEWKDGVVGDLHVHANSGDVLAKRHVVVLDTRNVVEAVLVASAPRFLFLREEAAAVEGSFLKDPAKNEDNDHA